MTSAREARRDAALPLQDKLEQRVLELAGPLTEDQWAGPTNCPPWMVKTIVAHLVRNAELFQMMLDCGMSGNATFPQTPEQREERQRELVAMPSADLVAEFARAHEAIRDRFKTLTAADLELPCPHPRAMMTGWWTVDQRVVELAFHSWDMATSLGQDAEIDAEAAQFILPMVIEQNLPSFHRGRPATSGPWRITATDMADGTWTVVPSDGEVSIKREPGDAVIAVSGPSGTILRWLYGRANLDEAAQAGTVTIEGDRSLVPSWKEMFPNP
jgi:uncharacterized protein (TIGR03083 family)